MYECVNTHTHTRTFIAIEAREWAQTVKFLLHNHEELIPSTRTDTEKQPQILTLMIPQ